MREADLFVLMDSVLFSKNSRTNRTKVFEKNKGWQWLTVPVRHGYGVPIRDVLVGGGAWRERHLNLLRGSYGDLKGFQELYALDSPFLIDYNLWSIGFIREKLGIDTPLVFLSELGLPGVLRGTDLLLAALRETGADVYLSGLGADGYMDMGAFKRVGVRVRFCTVRGEDFSALDGVLRG